MQIMQEMQNANRKQNAINAHFRQYSHSMHLALKTTGWSGMIDND